MPNYVTNVIEIQAKGKTLENILNAIRRDGDAYGSVDFNKLIPMPDSLNLTEGSVTDQSVRAYISNLRDEIVAHPDRPGSLEEIKRYVDAGKQILSRGFFAESFQYMLPDEIALQAEKHNMPVQDFLELGKKYLDNQLEYGSATWWSWCIEHWGCKWNVEEGSMLENDHTLRFETAWSAPLRFLEALSKKFPTTVFSHQWADEDIGNNVGCIQFRGGHILSHDLPEPGSKRAYEMAFEIQGITPQDRCMRYDIKEGTYVYDESLEECWDRGPSKNPSIDNVIDLAKSKTLLSSGQTPDTPGKEDPER